MANKTRTATMTAGQALSRARKSAAIDQAELGRRTGTVARTVSRWENDRGAIPADRQRAILRALSDAAPQQRAALARLFGAEPEQAAMTLAPHAGAAPPVARGGADALRDAVFAWAEFLDVSPRKVKIVLLEAFALIEERKLSREEVLAALAPPAGQGPRWRRA